eukprot:Rhum_TRINITY_DN16908_c0_g1::Rhum_TRINITY_DN16908_c0_g1_i1::g.164777::m.164777
MSEVAVDAPAAVELQVKGFLTRDLELINSVSREQFTEKDLDDALGRQMRLFGEGEVSYTYVEGSQLANMCMVHVLQVGGLGMEDWVKCLKTNGQWQVEEWGQDEPEPTS